MMALNDRRNRLHVICLTIFLPCITVVARPIWAADPSPIEQAFKAQIIVDLNVQATVSPGSGLRDDWSAPPRWNVNNRVATVFVLVQISPSLIDAAVEYWAQNHPSISAASKEAASAKLRKQYLRTNERPFLLLVKPIVASNYRDEWGVRIGPIAENVQLVNLDGNSAKVVRAETTLDDMLDGTSGIKACLFWVSDNVNEIDPTFNIRLSNVYYFIKHSGRGGKKIDWLQAQSPEVVYFRFETGEVSILRMMQDGVPWEEIEEKYIQTELRFAAASSYNGVANFVADIAVDLVVGLLLKAI